MNLDQFPSTMTGRPPKAKPGAEKEYLFGLGGSLRMFAFDFLRSSGSDEDLGKQLPAGALTSRTWFVPRFGLDIHFGLNVLSKASSSVKSFSPGFGLIFGLLSNPNDIRPYVELLTVFHILTLFDDSKVLITVEPRFGVELFLMKSKRLSFDISVGLPITGVTGVQTTAYFMEFANLNLAFRYYF